MSTSPGVILRSPAKINLALSVGPPAPPHGYHPIASWFVPIDLADTIEIAPATCAESTYRLDWAADALSPTPIDWPLEKDLGVRAHRLLEGHVGRPLPVAVSVQKRIPVGGGLGGGSSNAATVLKGVNEVFGLGLDSAALRSLGEKLGSDVAFFIDDGTATVRGAIVTGYGERIERAAGPAQSVLLFFPPFGCPTADVYRAYDAAPAPLNEARVRELVRLAGDRGRIDSSMLFNDLAEPACRVRPELAGVRHDLARALGDSTPVHVTGSGSTLYALVDGGEAPALAERCRRARPDVAVCPATILGSRTSGR